MERLTDAGCITLGAVPVLAGWAPTRRDAGC
jgi:hypothetical protein